LKRVNVEAIWDLKTLRGVGIVGEAAMAVVQGVNLANLYLAEGCAGEMDGLITSAWTYATVSH
jgi:hypothetical protein